LFEKYIGIGGCLAGVRVRVTYFDFAVRIKNSSHCLAEQWEAFLVLLSGGLSPSCRTAFLLQININSNDVNSLF